MRFPDRRVSSKQGWTLPFCCLTHFFYFQSSQAARSYTNPWFICCPLQCLGEPRHFPKHFPQCSTYNRCSGKSLDKWISESMDSSCVFIIPKHLAPERENAYVSISGRGQGNRGGPWKIIHSSPAWIIQWSYPFDLTETRFSFYLAQSKRKFRKLSISPQQLNSWITTENIARI